MSVLVDANVLLYAKFSDFSQHPACRDWLDTALNQPDPVGLPWLSLMAFLRIGTNRRVFARPLKPEQAVAQIKAWIARANVWHPEPGERFASVFTDLVRRHHATGNLVTDAYLAALAREHGLTVISTDSDFARFDAVPWVNPLAA